MKTMTLKASSASSASLQKTKAASIVDKWAKKFVMDVLGRLNKQRIILEDGDNRYFFGEAESTQIHGI